MSKTFQEKIEELKKPFSKEYLQFRPQGGIITWGNKKKARLLCYVDSRGVQNRLDDVFGAENWKNEIVSIQSIKVNKYNKEEEVGGMIHAISIKNDDGEWITKMDGADFSDVEAFKGGISDSLKRAGVMWGIGRYLYDLKNYPDITFVELFEDKSKVTGEYGIDYSSITTKENGKNVTYYYQCPDVEKVFPVNGKSPLSTSKDTKKETDKPKANTNTTTKKPEPKKEVKKETPKEEVMETPEENIEKEQFQVSSDEGMTSTELLNHLGEYLKFNKIEDSRENRNKFMEKVVSYINENKLTMNAPNMVKYALEKMKEGVLV